MSDQILRLESLVIFLEDNDTKGHTKVDFCF